MASSSSSSSLLFCAFTLSSLLSMVSSSEDDVPATIVIPLKSRFTKNPSTDPRLFLQQLAPASLSGAHHFKHGKNMPPLQTPVFPTSAYHYIDLSFGTPPQTISFMVDTGSDMVWFPCTTHYRCINCSSTRDHKKIPIFNPRLSSSSKVLDCRNPKCVLAPHRDIDLSCPHCNSGSKRCSRNCPYSIQYAKGAATGHYLLENLNFPGKTFHNFLVGCSTASEADSTAFAGFGNTTLSLPLQMGAKKFAYCLKSHEFHDTRNSSKLFIDYNNGDTQGLSYTPFVYNPNPLYDHYYLSVEDIMIGDKPLRIPHKYLAPGSDGRGGVIIDSGFSTGYMAKPVYSTVTAELKRQMSKYRRSFEAERELQYSPCYNFTGRRSRKFPDLVYKFTSGARMVVPGENYFLSLQHFLSLPGLDLWCFPVSTDNTENQIGPSVILGNFQQVDFYVEFDLKNKRFGFRKQTC